MTVGTGTVAFLLVLAEHFSRSVLHPMFYGPQNGIVRQPQLSRSRYVRLCRLYASAILRINRQRRSFDAQATRLLYRDLHHVLAGRQLGRRDDRKCVDFIR
jgi:hypothetical protein